MKQVSIGNSTINLVDQGSGPVMLLVHGFPLDHSMWEFQIEQLSKHFRIICPDLPGFGSSPRPAQPITIRQMADDLAMMIDKLEIPTVTFCGLSMGGYIGWQFWKHYPDKLTALIACDTRAAADSDTVAKGRRVQAAAVRKNGSESIAAGLIEKLFEPGTSQTELVASIRQTIVGTDPETVAQAQLAMAARPDATPWLAQIDIPTLLVVGAHDQITPPAEMRTLAGQIPGSTLVEVSAAGHMAPLENPQEFNRAVVEFVE